MSPAPDWIATSPPDPPNRYVVGFMVDPTTDNVVLVKKNRPEWQKGKLNGVGGHIEVGESPIQAMEREFKEETGLYNCSWEFMLTMYFPAAAIWFYRSISTMQEMKRVLTTTDEDIDIFNISSLISRGGATIPNLRWLLPMAAYQHDTYAPFVLYTTHPY